MFNNNSFKEKLSDWVSEIHKKYSYSHEEKAFIHLYLSRFRSDHSFSEEEIRKHIVDGKNDLGVDAIYVSDDAQNLVLIQSKYSPNDALLKQELEKGDKFLINLFELNGGSRQTLLQTGNIDLVNILKSEVFPKDWKNVEFVYLCGSFSLEIKSSLDNLSQKYLQNNLLISYIEVEKLEGMYDPYHVKNEVSIELKDNEYFKPNTQDINIMVDGTSKTITVKYCLCSVRASNLKKLYEDIGDSLFEANVRNFLSFRKPINRQIKIEVERGSKSNLWFFNNGIVAVCEGFSIGGGKIIAKNLQVVNGGQTIRSIASTLHVDDTTSIVLKITSIENAGSLEIETKRNFLNQMAVNSNRQSPISSRDLRANDEIQRRLQEKFKDFNYFYQIKAGEEKIDDWKNKLKKQKRALLNSNIAASYISLFLQVTDASSGRVSLAFLPIDEGDPVINYKNIFGNRAQLPIVFKKLFFTWQTQLRIDSLRESLGMDQFPFHYYSSNIILALFGYWLVLNVEPNHRNKDYDQETVRNVLCSDNFPLGNFFKLDHGSKTFELLNEQKTRGYFNFLTENIHDVLSNKGIANNPRAISSFFKKDIAVSEIANRIRPKIQLRNLYIEHNNVEGNAGNII